MEMWHKILIILGVLYLSIDVSAELQHYNFERSDMEKFVADYKYPIQRYTVRTEDNYILTLFRISGDNKGKQSTRGPLLILHGIGATSQSAVTIGERSMGFSFARKGYDVWLANFRGNKYSRMHTTLSTSAFNSEYWSFSLYHLGVYDVPAIIETINKETGGQQKIICVAHSMGTTAAFIYSSIKNDEAHQFLKGIIAMAPVGYLDNNEKIRRLSELAPTLKYFFNLFDLHGLFTREELQSSILVPLVNNWLGIKLTRKLINIQYGTDPDQIMKNDIVQYFRNWPSGIGVNILLNFAAFVTEKKPQGYDYGSTENMKIYKSETPPVFDYSRINIPVHLLYGPNDEVADTKDVEELFDSLSTTKKKLSISQDGKIPFNHIDFIFAKDIESLLFIHIENAIAEFST